MTKKSSGLPDTNDLKKSNCSRADIRTKFVPHVNATAADVSMAFDCWANPRFRDANFQIKKLKRKLGEIETIMDQLPLTASSSIVDKLFDAQQSFRDIVDQFESEFPSNRSDKKLQIIEFVMACYFLEFGEIPKPNFESKGTNSTRVPNNFATQYIAFVLKRARADAKLNGDYTEEYKESSGTSAKRKTHIKELPGFPSEFRKLMESVLKKWGENEPPHPKDVPMLSGNLSIFFGDSYYS